jgi:hypothetical protein
MQRVEYINNTILVTRQQDFWGRGENGGEFLMYYFGTSLCRIRYAQLKVKLVR